MEENIFFKIENMKDSFTAVEQRIAEFVLENPEKIPNMSIKEIAKKSETSDASVLRFCRTLGFSGYRGFIVSMSMANVTGQENEVTTYNDIKPGDSAEVITDSIFYNTVKAVEDTRKMVKPANLQKAIDMLWEAEQIRFFGIGESGLACIYAYQKFMRIRKMSYAHTDSYEQLMAAEVMTKRDVAVIVTYSGKTKEIVDVYNLLRSKDIPIILITKYQKSRMANEADVVLNITAPELTIRTGATSTLLSTVCVIDLLFTAVSSVQYRDVKKYLNDTINIIEEYKK